MNRPGVIFPILAATAALLLGEAASAQEEAQAPAQARDARPCQAGGLFDDFDFWVGVWEVSTPDGKVAGENTIRKLEQGCLLLENWASANGGTGTSMNYYDPARQMWVQVWVGLNLLIDIEGGLEDGAMRLTGTIHYLATDQRAPFRGTWTPLDDGRVRQFFEQSNDAGKTWSPWFAGYYTRKVVK